MGKLAMQILPLNKEALLKDLNRTYSDEWCAHYNYLFVANTLRGESSVELLGFIRDKGYRALEQANEFAARISQLGGEPVSKLKDLLKTATDKPFKLPQRRSDVAGTLRAVLDAERTAIRTYKELFDQVVNQDPVTENLVTQCLSRAVADEDRLERYLGDTAPEMNGK